MQRCVLGMCADVDRIIHEKSVPCVGCKRETEKCVKLYKGAGNNDTICAELSDN